MAAEVQRGAAATTHRAQGAADVASSPTLLTSTGSTIVPAQRSDANWQLRFTRRLWISDTVVLVWVVFGTQIFWFGTGNAQLSLLQDHRFSDISYWVLSTVLIGVWLWALSLADSRSHRVIGAGAAEYIRIVDSSIRLFGVIAILAFLFQINIARGFLLISLPVGVVMLVAVRWLWRQWLIAKRRNGSYMHRVLLVGSESSAAQIAHELHRNPRAGYLVAGACVPSGKVADMLLGTDIPVMGNVDAVDRALAVTGADTVAVTSADELPPAKVKQISWGLEAGKQHLVLAPSIADIAGPRIHIRPMSGLPLIHVETPRFSLGQRVIKRLFDLAAAILGVIVISPVLLTLTVTIMLSSTGPVLFRQERVGRNGKTFKMIKFRSMVPNAEQLLERLLQEQRDAGNEVLFKMKNDPRVTPIGRVMRKYSLDELPQLFNVIGGSMSLVGPRPPLRREVEQYADHVHRRFLMKPGITGLWQVSGRSSLSWDESVRLDLSYVENWSLVGDLTILLKTARAALAPGETAH